MTASTTDLATHFERHVAVVELRRPPSNFFDLELLTKLADTFDELQQTSECRAVVLAAQGRVFCAGADFSEGSPDMDYPAQLYAQAERLFAIGKPVVAAVQGAAVGGGLGLALAADFRIGCPEARFTANFAKLGFHPGFGLSFTLPRLIGVQKAALLMYTGRNVRGQEALDLGLVDELVPQAEVLERSIALATEIAANAPLAVEATRQSIRGDFAAHLHAAVTREAMEQRKQFQSADFREGIAAAAARRAPVFFRR